MSLHNGILFVSPPPPGVTPNIDAPYEASELLGVISFLLPIACVIMGVRVYSRAMLSGNFALDDWLMVIAFVLGAIMIGFILDMLNWGLGKHIWDVPLQPHLMPNWSLDNVLAAIFFCAATGFAKGSILLFYLRIFPTRRMQWVVWLSFAFVMTFSLASVLVNMFSCSPVSGSWNPATSETAVCIDRPVFYFAQAGLGIFADVLTLALPLPMLRTLQMPLKQKIGVAIVLTMGGFVCVVSVVRLQTLGVLMTDADLTKNTTTALTWCVVELFLSIIGGSIPALKPFIRRFLPRLLGSTYAARRGIRTRNSRAYLSGGALHQQYYRGEHGHNSSYDASRRRSLFKFPTSAASSPRMPEFILETVRVQVTSCGEECLCGTCRRDISAGMPAVKFAPARKRSAESCGSDYWDMALEGPVSDIGGGHAGDERLPRISTPRSSQQQRQLGHDYSIEGPRRAPSLTSIAPMVSAVNGVKGKHWRELR